MTSPERIRVSVEDTGAGLPPEKLTQLFQPFNRLGQESSAEEGTGIGLVMSKRVVELMGGVIDVHFRRINDAVPHRGRSIGSEILEMAV